MLDAIDIEIDHDIDVIIATGDLNKTTAFITNTIPLLRVPQILSPLIRLTAGQLLRVKKLRAFMAYLGKKRRLAQWRVDFELHHCFRERIKKKLATFSGELVNLM